MATPCPDPLQIARAVICAVPGVLPYLSPVTREFLGKTYEFFLSTLERLIQSLYDGNIGGEFIGILQDLILGQISQAYESAWIDEGNELPVPEYLRDASQVAVLEQHQYVDGFYREIIDAKVDDRPVAPFLSRASLWANQYTSEYNNAIALITAQEGGNLLWQYGDTEHCPECEALNGIVARAKEWEELDVHPQNPPNDLITCGGWHCQCALVPTTQRRSPKAYDTIMNIVSR